MNSDYLRGKVFEDILTLDKFTVKETAKKHGMSIRYFRKMVLKPLKIKGLVKIIKNEDYRKEKTDKRLESYIVNKEKLLKLMPKLIQTDKAQETIKLFQFITTTERITPSNMRKELGYHPDKVKTTLERLVDEGYLIEAEGDYTIKDKDKLKEMFIDRPFRLFKDYTKTEKEQIDKWIKEVDFSKL